MEERSSQLFSQLKQLRKESLKKTSGLNGNRSHDIRDAGAVLYQLSYQANWDLNLQYDQLMGSIPVQA